MDASSAYKPAGEGSEPSPSAWEGSGGSATPENGGVSSSASAERSLMVAGSPPLDAAGSARNAPFNCPLPAPGAPPHWRYPILGASVIGLTVGPPLGFAGYMLFNYSKVQQMEAKFREAQAMFEARRRGFPGGFPGGFGGPPFAGGPSGVPLGWRADDSAAAGANAASWTSPAALDSAQSPSPSADELLKE
ncbi:hypothetical protein cyc_00921 [Cyclospora cayetanensis]|uniref:Transmembrane protein n=1 Tax=Cyclospora cayetanensis TaxID=88456 RepID=A0A1D3D4Z7_9EIME|nr:hypothetical protein cyc_00921 [Cyclospora cayetanensis]